MISHKSLKAYLNQYPNDEGCGYANPSGEVLITNEKGESVVEPYDNSETDDTFMDRLKRSKKKGRNLFFEEWEPFEYVEGADY